MLCLYSWDYIIDGLIVGSCPREPSDVERLSEEAGVQAIVCLQSEVCDCSFAVPIQRT